MIPNTSHLTPDMCYMTQDTWHMTSDTWHTGGDEFCQRITSWQQSLYWQTPPLVKKKYKYKNMKIIIVTPDTWKEIHDTWHLTLDMWQIVGGEHCLKMSATYLLQFECNDVMKVWRKRITQWMNQLMSNEGDCRTALAKPGLVISPDKFLNIP